MVCHCYTLTKESFHIYPHQTVAALAANHCAKACAFLVCINTVPGPVNLHTSPSPEAIFDSIPPDATRSSTYLQFQATRWPLSMMYFSLAANYTHIALAREVGGIGRKTYIFPDNCPKARAP
jgi:hypothetical protein